MGLASIWGSLKHKKVPELILEVPKPVVQVSDAAKYAPRLEGVMTRLSKEQAKRHLIYIKEAMEHNDESEVQIRQQILANGGIEVPTNLKEAEIILSKYQ
jgi:hypothetical protein